jgi:hypothetical protein
MLLQIQVVSDELRLEEMVVLPKSNPTSEHSRMVKMDG